MTKHEQAIEIVKAMNSIEEFYRYDWDKLAFGMEDGDIIKLMPSEITIVHEGDMENAVHKIGNERQFGKHFDEPLSKLPPVEVNYDGVTFTLQDGHHRYELAKRLKKSLKCEVSIKANPFLFMGIEDVNTDDFYWHYHTRPLKHLKSF